MKRLVPILALFLLAACGGSDTAPSNTVVTTTAPYSVTDLVVGTGATAVAGNTLGVTYSGWLHDASKPDAKGTLFDSGVISFQLGAGRVIRGWDTGLLGMRVGGSRRLVLPPEYAYGAAGSGPIPPNATLVFDVTLNSVQ